MQEQRYCLLLLRNTLLTIVKVRKIMHKNTGTSELPIYIWSCFNFFILLCWIHGLWRYYKRLFSLRVPQNSQICNSPLRCHHPFPLASIIMIQSQAYVGPSLLIRLIKPKVNTWTENRRKHLSCWVEILHNMFCKIWVRTPTNWFICLLLQCEKARSLGNFNLPLKQISCEQQDLTQYAWDIQDCLSSSNY